MTLTLTDPLYGVEHILIDCVVHQGFQFPRPNGGGKLTTKTGRQSCAGGQNYSPKGLDRLHRLRQWHCRGRREGESVLRWLQAHPCVACQSLGAHLEVI